MFSHEEQPIAEPIVSEKDSMPLLLLLLLLCPLSASAEDLGDLSANPFDSDSTANPFGAGSPVNPDGINNPFSPYGRGLRIEGK